MASVLCMGLLLMFVNSVEAQAAPSFISTINDTSHVRVYIPDLPYDDATFNENSLLYPVIRGLIEDLLAEGGATLSDLDARDGGGCAELFIQWTGGDIAELTSVFVKTEKEGLSISDLNIYISISFQGCDSSLTTSSPPMSTVSSGTTDSDDMTTYSLFITGWTSVPGLDDPSSETFTAIKTLVQGMLTPYGTVLEDIAFEDDGNGCLEIWLQMRGGDIGSLTNLLVTDLTEKGIEIFGKIRNVTSDNCLMYRKNGTEEPSKQLHSTTLYISGLIWKREYENPISDHFQVVKTAINTAFENLGGQLVDLKIMPSGGCIMLNIMWRLEIMEQSVKNLIETMAAKGLMIKNEMYQVHKDFCPSHNLTVCDFLNGNLCGSNGKCAGDTDDEWKICSCDVGFGGLFCENNTPDNMTQCEIMKRTSLFVHRQIIGEEEQLPSMNATMKEIVSKLMNGVYYVPHCHSSSNVSKDNFYSMCEHDGKNGQKLQCVCLDENGQPNNALYVAEDDCRHFGKYLYTIKGEMFIHNLAWTQDLMMDSELYTNIKSQIDRYMSPANGYISELKISPWGNNGCVKVYIVYRAERGVTAKTLFYSLPGASLLVKDENKTVSLFPCKEDIDVNACPKPSPDSFSICLDECGVNRTCKDGLTCCDNACGQGICKELGFLQKMKMSITMNITFMSAYEDASSPLYGIFEDNVINAIGSVMSSNGIDGFSSVKVLGFKRVKYQPRHRKRRQAEEFDNTVILLEFRFTTEIPVEKLMQVQDHVRENGFVFDGTKFTVMYLTLGKEGKCGSVECSYDSICVETLREEHQCVCPPGRAGSNCLLTVCQNPDGSSMCQNNAPCRYDEVNNKYRCHCEIGYHGEYCETKVCDLFKSDVCNDGTCVGDIIAMELCSCPIGKAGLFCQYNVGPDYNQTYCEKHHTFASYVVGVLNGSNSGIELSGDVSDLFPLFNATREILFVPTCRYDNSYQHGQYHYLCGFDTDTGLRSKFQDCMCVNGDGSPNYWTFQDGQCVVYAGETMKPCERKPCMNGGVCHNMPDNEFSCYCVSGFHGKTCQYHHKDQCPHGGSPLYKSFGLWTCGTDRPCPVGFHCHGSSFNGSCCFKPDFLCDLDLCKNGSTCVGDLQSGQVCQCPPGKAGLFCEKEDDGVKLTFCQQHQRFRNWLLKLLETAITPGETTVYDFRQLLIHIGITHIPKDSCDDNGEFKTKVKSASVLNVKDEIDLCFSRSGEYDGMCKDEICDTVKDFGICMNGGECIGDLTRSLCDCSGTGYGGAICERPGEDHNGTDCTKVRELFHFAKGLINGTKQIYPGVDISLAMQNLLASTHIESVFEPYCDEYGRYAYKGCAYTVPTMESKKCYCTSDDLQQVGDATSYVEPPERCPMGPDRCPMDWGPECERPNWWCTHEKKCRKGSEKCYFSVDCDDEECSKNPKISCVPVELQLPCEPRPCKDNKYEMCPPCGEEASCFHISKGNFNLEDKDDKDDDDSEEKGDKYDDNDSEEKNANGGKRKDDDDSEEDSTNMPWKKPPKGQNYICECPIGRSGPNCEVHDEICNSIPSELCPLGCIGDLEHGIMCRCPEGYAGVTCERVARTPCEIQQAFNGDSINILRGIFKIPGYSSNELKNLVQALVRLTDGDSIPETNCTENGFYAKVQCYVNIYDVDIKHCFCVSSTGEPIASNILPHVGYDVCTGPLDMRSFVGLCLRQDLQLCQNGGSCVFDLYGGKICDCPYGFSGQFCEKQEQSQGESETFCEFMRDAFYYVHDMVINNGTLQNDIELYHYGILASFLGMNSNRNTKGYNPDLVALKMECQIDGNFKHYACDHYLPTEERIACYCLGKDGPLIGTEASDPEDLDCSDLRHLVCHELDNCPHLECEHGHRHDLQYCPICECRQPCEGFKCQYGERCVVKDYDCDGRKGKCTMPMCVRERKPGVCPGHKTENLGSIQSRIMSDASMYGDDVCQVKCRDDADCEGSKKCCGLCGSKCVEPQESEDCTDQYEIMTEYLEFIKSTRNITIPASFPRSMFKVLDETDRVHEIWMPTCVESNYAPVQCMYNVSALLRGTDVVTHCFCVDPLGHHIKGSVGYFGNESSCAVKPYSCPTLHPSTDDDARDECMEDRDCLMSSKCCYDGFHHVCAKPVSEPKDDYPIDRLMADICMGSPDICSSGPCTSEWKTEGKVCVCGDYITGPFCETPVFGEIVKPRTACERKRLTTYLFWTSLGKIYTTDTPVYEYTKIDLVISQATESLIKEVPEHEHDKIPLVMYDCDDDGNYAPVQCDLSMFTEEALECFCVDEEGHELPGTRRPADKPLPYCNKQRTCDIGHALHGPNGDPVMCDKDNRCPYGYDCARGLHGNLYCCPNEEEKKDICNHPVDVGYECEDVTPSMNYYYQTDTDSCVSFNFKGCGGNRNRFESMDDCVKRCNEKIHLGSCPSKAIDVAQANNCDQNECDFDADCPSDRLKCCNSTCGMRCIPAIAEFPTEGQCPVGLRKPEPKTCLYNYQCGDGYKCHFGGDNTDLLSHGFCCLDIRNIDYCRVKPFAFMMEKMKEDSDEDKYDSDEDKYDSDEDKYDSDEDKYDSDEDSSDEDDDENRWGKPGMVCEKLMPRFYYNHEHSRCDMYYGCEEDFNTFKTRDDCCKTCSNERRCREGKCPIPNPDIAVSCRDMCVYDYECPGRKICCNTGCSMNCVDPHDETNATCLAEQREAKKALGVKKRGDTCHAVYIPMCEENGEYARQQCHTSRGVCWCVTGNGNYLNGSITRGVASCHHFSQMDIFLADSYPRSVHTVQFEVCPQNQKMHCCSETLCQKRCHAHPGAMCRINPCGGCRAEYFDADNNIVNCTKDLTPCQLELQDAVRVVRAKSITANKEEKNNEDEEEEERKHEMAEKMMNDWGSSIRIDIPLKCQKLPETGNCRGFARRWFYNPQTKKCSMFIWGMCGGNENRFRTPKECYDECDPPSNPCAAVRCGTPASECTLTYDEDCYSFEEGCQLQPQCTEKETHANLVDGVFIPRCLSTGSYNYKQCLGRYCWCVNDDGEYAGGLTSNAYYGDLQCTSSGPTAESVVNLPDCPAGSYTQKPQHKCLKACSNEICPGYPKAECVVDLCSESCMTKFEDEYGNTVNCEADECKAFSFEYRDQCAEGVLCDEGTAKNCPSNVCQGARQRLCPQNPCAVCMVDSCTCQPYFVDVITSERVDIDSNECKYLTKGTCTIQTCKLMVANAPVDLLPQCTSKGSFRAKQCHDSNCFCVDGEGHSLRNVSANGNCEEIDDIAKIELVLAFNGDFDLLKRQGKLSKVKDAVRAKLINNGVPEENIYYISEPYKGSTIVDVILQEKKDDPNSGNINLLANTISQKIQNNDFNLNIDGEELALQEDKTTFVLVPQSIVDGDDDDDDDDDGLSDKEIIIIAACGGGVALLLLVAVICCCCCRKKKEPQVVDDTYDHIRERPESGKNVYDNPVTMYNNKSFEAEGHYMDVQDTERYMKVRL